MIMSVLTYVICSWYKGCGSNVLREIARVEKRSKRLIKREYHKLLLTSESVYKNTAMATVKKLLADPQHPLHSKLNYMPHGIRLRLPFCRTNRYLNSPIPSMINLFNKHQ